MSPFIPCAPVVPVVHIGQVGQILPVDPVAPVAPCGHTKAVAGVCLSLLASCESIKITLSAETMVFLAVTS